MKFSRCQPLKDYQSALNQVFALKEMNLSSSQEISMLIKSFVKSCHPREARSLKRDICLKVRSLMSHLYKTLEKVSDKDLTLKTLFLLVLVLAKRVGELNCLSAEICHLEGFSSLAFSFVPDFVAKTQNSLVPDERLDGFSVSSFWDFIGDNPDEMVLCPITAIQLYLKRRKQYRLECTCLIISTGRNKKEVLENTISF